MGCGGAPTAPAIPKQSDPTPLAKCHVKASQSSPLVTEWPASEKAHLESALTEGAVAVAYSGCELTILDQCHVSGNYQFRRTTLSKDVIEISDQDELYAKLPLGAASLEGELTRSGRLAVRTTIAGQLKLTAAPDSLPSSAGCAKATHLVTALSVGAFKLLAGGSAGAKASAEGFGVGAGGKTKREEETLREAGDPGACAAGGKKEKGVDQANPDCASPIQIFLEPIEHGSGASADASDTPPPLKGKKSSRSSGPVGEEEDSNRNNKDNAVKVAFELPSDGGRWSLRSGDGKVMCDLPCSRWVGPHSGYVLQLDADKSDDIKKVKVPDDIGYSPGREVKAIPYPGRNSPLAGWGVTLGGLGLVFGVVMIVNATKGCTADLSTSANTHDLCTPGIIVTAASGAAAAAGLGVWLGYNRADKLDVTLQGNAASRRGPGVGLNPFGVVGAF